MFHVKHWGGSAMVTQIYGALPMRRFVTYVVLPLALILLTVKYCNIGQYEQPKYELIDARDMIELRAYAPVIVAEVTAEGERSQAIGAGFRKIADFIFGNNQSQKKIAMTAPVIQHPSEKIAMTTPVIQQGKDGKWVVQFIMPSEYTLETLPKPVDKEVRIKALPARTMAAIRFSGRTDDTAQITDRTAELQAYIVLNKLKTKGAPQLAFYDPPWTLPFLRRNEVLIEIAAPAKKR